eukprot:7248615-Alexandrium_andersonii.AAC.1
MSASLVGSEMCIRDSCSTRRRDSRPPAKQYFEPASSERLHTHERTFGTVSYTHLTLPTICSV